jgi:hypothetical protein
MAGKQADGCQPAKKTAGKRGAKFMASIGFSLNNFFSA